MEFSRGKPLQREATKQPNEHQAYLISTEWKLSEALKNRVLAGECRWTNLSVLFSLIFECVESNVLSAPYMKIFADLVKSLFK